MTRKIFMVLVLGIIIGAVPGMVLAEGPGYSGDHDSISSRMSSGSASSVDADVWPSSGPVETGAVPGDPNNDKLSPNDTHFNPQHPDLRIIDLGGGGE